MDTTDLKLNENEQQMFGQLFSLYGLHESADSPTVPQSVAKQLLNASHLEPKLLDQIMDLSGCRRKPALTRSQFYAMLKLVGAAQSGLPLNADTLNTNALTIPLPQLSPIVVDATKQQLIANNIDDMNETSVHQMSGHLPPPPTKSSVRSNRRNNQLSNSDSAYRPPVDSHNNYNSLNNNLNKYNNNHNENDTKSETESETSDHSRSSSANDVNDDSPIDAMIDKSYDYRDKSWSEFNDKKKDKPLNWADFDEEHHLLEDGDDDEEEEREDDAISYDSSIESADIWSISEEQRSYYTNQFKAMQSNLNGTITGNKAKDFFEKSNLPIHELSQIWLLSDIDKDGGLTLNEFCIAMHLVVLRRNQVELPTQLPPSLVPEISPEEVKHNTSLNSSKSTDLIADTDQHYKSLTMSPNRHNDLIQIKAKSADPLSPQNKEWTKFNDSPTHQIVVTTATSPPSTSSSAGIQTLANFDFSTASIVRDPKILHPVAVRLSPDGQPIRYDNNEVIQSLESSTQLISLTDKPDGQRPANAVQGKKDPPPPPPPRPQRSHARSSSLDLNINRTKGRSGVANDLISSQIPPYLKVSNSEYGLTAPHKEIPSLSRNLGAFHAYRKTATDKRTDASLKNNIINNGNSVIDALRLRYKIPADVTLPDSSADCTQLWQTIMSFQEYCKTLENINIDLLRELNKANEEKHSLELRLAQVSNGCKL